MKKTIVLLTSILSFNLLFSQTNFDKGFNIGYKKGYCQDQGVGCIAPIPPIAPIPTIYENLDSYNDGYNRGFKMGSSESKKETSNTSTRNRYKTTEGKYINKNNPELENKVFNLQLEIIPKIVDRGMEHLENEKYDDALDDASYLLKIKPNLPMAYLIRSNALFHKGQIVDSYNNGIKAYKLLPKLGIAEWKNFISLKMRDYLIALMAESDYSSVLNTCNNSWYNTSIIRYFKGSAYYYMSDYKKAKKEFRKLNNDPYAKKYLRNINLNNFLPNPYLKLKKNEYKKNEFNTVKQSEKLSNRVLFETMFDNPIFEINLYTEPNVNSKVRHKCPKNSKVKVIDNSGEIFFKVIIDGYSGYVSKHFLKRQW